MLPGVPDIILNRDGVLYDCSELHIELDMAWSFDISGSLLPSQRKGTSLAPPSGLACSSRQLSQRIKAIELELDVQLFRRMARGVELTEAGRVFLDNACALLAQYDRTFESTRGAARGEQGHLRIGVMPTAPFHPFVPFAIRSFRTAFPSVSLTLDECLRTEAVQRLQNAEMDVAFFRSSLSEPKQLVTHPLLVEPMLVALPSEHVLALRGEALSLKALADETFIVYARQLGSTFYDATIAACLKAGFSPRLGQEAPRITSALSLVAAGFGISIVPASMQRMNMDGVSYCPLKGPPHAKAELTIASRRSEPSVVVRNFLGLVRRAAKDFEQPNRSHS